MRKVDDGGRGNGKMKEKSGHYIIASQPPNNDHLQPIEKSNFFRGHSFMTSAFFWAIFDPSPCQQMSEFSLPPSPCYQVSDF